MKNILIGGVVAAILFGAGAYLVIQHSDAVPVRQLGNERQLYQSERYGFGFEIPEGYEYFEYVPEVIAIGVPNVNGEGFDSQVDVRLYTAGEDVGYERYEDFLFETLRNSCAADGPSETIYCEEVERHQPFTTSSDISGEVMYLSRTQENFSTGAMTQDGFGPHFVFNVSANVPNAQFAVLVVGAPAYLSADEVNSELVRQVAESVQIDRVTARFEKELVLISDVSTTGGATVMTADRVEWLQGDAAYAAVAEDTECTEETAEECVASLFNNFYIRNVEVMEGTYAVDPDVEVLVQEQAQLVEGTIGDIEVHAEEYGPVLATVETRDDVIIFVEEMYLP